MSRFTTTYAPKQDTGYRVKKCSENAQPQNEILCSKGAWGRCPRQADGRKCGVCINTRIACQSCVWLSTRIACLYL